MPALAKLTRPKVHRALLRDRLFEHLDEARERPLVWVVAPPGSGKTTLISSYVEARKLRTAWYHVDAGDDDIGTFFYYLAQTLPVSRSKREEPLPLFSPAYLADLPAFCRHFFRTFFARHPSPGLLAEPSLGRTVPGTRVIVYTDSRPDQPYEARIGSVSPQAEFTPRSVETTDLRTSLVYRVRVLIDKPDSALRQGMPVTVRFAGAEKS